MEEKQLIYIAIGLSVITMVLVIATHSRRLTAMLKPKQDQNSNT